MQDIDRYNRQILLAQIGIAGQRKLADARVLIVGCGALGSVAAEQLARAGIGFIRTVDRDVVELSNLQRQVLFEESDAQNALPKAIAAAKRLRAINAQIAIEPHVLDLDAGNIDELARDCAVIVDGTDNVETRYLLNDYAIRESIPWIYGACIGTEGRAMAIRPGDTPCLRCVFPEIPAPGELPTCDTAGVLGPVAGVVGSSQAIAAIKLLTGNVESIANELVTFDLWHNRIRTIDLSDARRADCPACALRRFSFLDAPPRELAVKLCGQNAVQVRPPLDAADFDLNRIATQLRPVGRVEQSPHLVRCALADSIQLTVFADGRAIVHGTNEPARARSLYARYIGA